MMRVFLVLVLFVAPALAWATLGGVPSGFPQQRQQQSSIARPADGGGATYRVVHTVLQSQTQVDEYVDASGRVFAVAWTGPFQPNLRDLLGESFGKLSQGVRTRSRMQVDDGSVHVEASGHMGAYRGRAWLPGSVPSGFDLQQIQ